MGVLQLMEVLQLMKVLQLTEVLCVWCERADARSEPVAVLKATPANVSTVKRNIPCALVRGFKNDQDLLALVEGAGRASVARCRGVLSAAELGPRRRRGLRLCCHQHEQEDKELRQEVLSLAGASIARACALSIPLE